MAVADRVLDVQLCLKSGLPFRLTAWHGKHDDAGFRAQLVGVQAVAESCPGKNSRPCQQRAMSPGTGLLNFNTSDPLGNDSEALQNIAWFFLA